MGAFSTGLMLMGIALIYGATGTFNIEQMNLLQTKPGVLLVAGLLLLLFSMSFKVSAAPFISGHPMYMMEHLLCLLLLWPPL